MEVIAMKKSGLLWVHIFCVILGGFLVIVSCTLMPFNKGAASIASHIISFIVGVAVGVTGLVITINIVRTPEKIIVYENGKLKCGETKFLPSEILNVEYQRSRARGIIYKWGKIKIILKDTTISYNFVAEVEQVHNRLIQLMLKNKQ